MPENKKHGGHQRGALDIEPGQQGDKTRGQQAESAKSGEDKKAGKRGAHHDPADIEQHNDVGKDRLFEDREQHDEAEKNSEKTRHARDVDKHHHGPQDGLADTERQASAKRKN